MQSQLVSPLPSKKKEKDEDKKHWVDESAVPLSRLDLREVINVYESKQQTHLP